MEPVIERISQYAQASLWQWLQSLPGMALDYFGWGGITAIVVGLLLVMAMSARLVKLLFSRRGMAAMAVATVVAIYFMPSWGGGGQEPGPVEPEPEPKPIRIIDNPIDPEVDFISSLASLRPAPSLTSPISAFAIQPPVAGAGLPIVNAAHHTVAPTHHAASHANNPAAGVHSLMPHGGSANHQLANTTAAHASASQAKPPLGSSALNGLAVNHKAPAKPQHRTLGSGAFGPQGGGMQQPYGPVHSPYLPGGGGHYQQQQMTPKQWQHLANIEADHQMNVYFATPGNYMPATNHMPSMGGGMQHIGGGMQHTSGVHHPYHH